MKLQILYKLKKIGVLLAVAAMALGAGCGGAATEPIGPINPIDTIDTSPKFKIVRLDFTAKYSTRPRVQTVTDSLANGADSVYLVSTENFHLMSTHTQVHLARDDAQELTAISPRVRGRGIINPTIAVDSTVSIDCKSIFESCGFQYIPGYIKAN